jgi:hypothetical protein
LTGLASKDDEDELVVDADEVVNWGVAAGRANVGLLLTTGIGSVLRCNCLGKNPREVVFVGVVELEDEEGSVFAGDTTESAPEKKLVFHLFADLLYVFLGVLHFLKASRLSSLLLLYHHFEALSHS